ncbi:hypothetical protein DOW39_06270 [Salmonella enterica subsp. enterica serovar Tanger]|nr:hypothetical protein [Salmonella enterica subsp. enterica serovar Tanger]EBV4601268.1 hypothetical protein [Salmonella enterica subsp. enterica serovar Tanger]
MTLLASFYTFFVDKSNKMKKMHRKFMITTRLFSGKLESGDSPEWKETSKGPNDSGSKGKYPNVYRMIAKNKHNDEVVVWLDTKYGLGKRLNVSDKYPSAFFVGYKSYFNLINGIPLIISTGQSTEVNGGLEWIRSN